jgi:uncharacterized delta-60 repeat protein
VILFVTYLRSYGREHKSHFPTNMNTNPVSRFVAVLSITVCAALTSNSAQAILGQPGTLDPTWVGFASGKVMTPVGGNDDEATAIVMQSDGKVVVAGTCVGSDGSDQFCAARYNANGSLDSSFGSAGKIMTSVAAGNDSLRAAAIQSDGKIVLAGGCQVSGLFVFCMVRYNSGGTALDSGFGSNGRVFTSMSSGDDRARAIAVQPDGKIVLAGTCNIAVQPVFCAARYNSDGSLDSSFDGNGKVSTLIGSEASANAMALQPNGRLILAGECTNSGQRDFCVARYNTNGSLDTSFNGNGLLATDIVGGIDGANAVAIQADGKIVVAGHCAAPAAVSNFCAARYASDGSLDSSFAGNGLVTTSFANGGSEAHGVAIQPDGKVLLGGSCGVVFCALRYNSDGGLDNTFAVDGRVSTQVNLGFERANAIALQNDGRIHLAGRCSNGSNYDFCIVRYDGGPFGAQNCKLDIDGDGKVLATTDMLIATRVALGVTGNAAIGGVVFPANATRNTWSEIRSYLVTHCGMNLP